MEIEALKRRIVEVATDRNHSQQKKELVIKHELSKHVSDALNAWTNLNNPEIHSDTVKERTEFLITFGIERNKNGSFRPMDKTLSDISKL